MSNFPSLLHNVVNHLKHLLACSNMKSAVGWSIQGNPVNSNQYVLPILHIVTIYRHYLIEKY